MSFGGMIQSGVIQCDMIQSDMIQGDVTPVANPAWSTR